MSVLLVDSHCHLDCLDYAQFGGDLESVLKNAEKEGVGHFLCVCINMENFGAVASIAAAHSNVYASVGVHPNEREGHEPAFEELVEMAGFPKIVAIGETGLDYYRSSGDMSWQQERFRRHIRAARTAGKPLIIHTRDAREDTLRIMREEKADLTGGVMHCFTEDWDTAAQAMEMNFYISFSGIVTFKNAQSLREIAAKVPLDRLLVETDAPYLAPVPYRGKSNQPAYVRHVAEHIAEVRGMSLESLAKETTSNFFRLFKPE